MKHDTRVFRSLSAPRPMLFHTKSLSYINLTIIDLSFSFSQDPDSLSEADILKKLENIENALNESSREIEGWQKYLY